MINMFKKIISMEKMDEKMENFNRIGIYKEASNGHSTGRKISEIRNSKEWG